MEKETQDVGTDVPVVGEDLQVRKRRHLRKAPSIQVAEVDREETQSDENVPRLASGSDVNKEEQTKKRRQKQVAWSRPAAKKAKTDKGKIPLVKEGTEPTKEPVVDGSPTIEELDQQVDELLAHPFVSEAVDEGRSGKDEGGQRDREEVLEVGVEEEEGQRDVGPSIFERRYRRRSLFSPKRLDVPSSHMVRNCMDVLMGIVNHATIRAVRSLPLKHKCAILCRNMAETSLLTGDVLYSAVRTESRRCRKIDRLMEEKYSLEREVKELKFECDSTFEIFSQVKADVDMVMEENQSLESKNEELNSSLKGEKGKVQTLENKVKELQAALEREKERCSKKNDELVSSYSKYHDILLKKMELDTRLNVRKEENEKLQTTLALVCDTSPSIICKLFLDG
ncbi:hypothetical protein Dimus_030053 [Dionaea muscipula]